MHYTVYIGVNLGALSKSNLGAHAHFGRRPPKKPTPAYDWTVQVLCLKNRRKKRLIISPSTCILAQNKFLPSWSEYAKSQVLRELYSKAQVLVTGLLLLRCTLLSATEEVVLLYMHNAFWTLWTERILSHDHTEHVHHLWSAIVSFIEGWNTCIYICGTWYATSIIHYWTPSEHHATEWYVSPW